MLHLRCCGAAWLLAWRSEVRGHGQLWPHAAMGVGRSSAASRPCHTLLTTRLCSDANNLQGRFSFYMTSSGEEATAIGSAAALEPQDVVFRWVELTEGRMQVRGGIGKLCWRRNLW